MKLGTFFRSIALSLAALVLLQVQLVPAQEAAPAPGAEQPGAEQPGAEQPAAAPPAESGQLVSKQGQVAEKYARLEELIFKMADFEATSNPRRSALLKQAYKQSKDRLTKTQLEQVVKLLTDQKLKQAIDGQKQAETDMNSLLELLLSENRADRLKRDQDRIKEYIKEIERLQRLQKSTRGRTEGGADPERVAEEQNKIADRTGDLADKLKELDGGEGQGGEGEPGGDAQGENQGQQEGDSKGKSEGDSKGKSEGDSKGDSEGESKGDKEGDSKGDKEGNSKGNSEGDKKGDSEGDKKGDSEGDSKGDSQGDSKGDSQGDSKGDSKGGQQQSDDNPTRQRVKAAEERMREAQRKLEEARRNEAIEEQIKAEEELAKAKAELEEILRQLREEELGRMLALLEERFTKMLKEQIKVYEGTLRLGQIPADKRDRNVDISAGKLSFQERKIAVDADRALTLLLEEGSSIAFPEAVEQMRDDMEQVVERLAETKVDRITQGIEEDIIKALEEMVAALQKAQQDLEESQPGQPGQPGQPSDPPLVDQIAELKMIKALQLRVNTRTQRYARLLDDENDPVGQATDDDLRSALNRLAEREQRIQQVTRDIVLGKNK
ncbi:MAG: hypothetical protein J5I93_14750 [Pirellulaceae bacterium]|nr:hypothetical protein [Pirellulaceae bacterium]